MKKIRNADTKTLYRRCKIMEYNNDNTLHIFQIMSNKSKQWWWNALKASMCCIFLALKYIIAKIASASFFMLKLNHWNIFLVCINIWCWLNIDNVSMRLLLIKGILFTSEIFDTFYHYLKSQMTGGNNN